MIFKKLLDGKSHSKMELVNLVGYAGTDNKAFHNLMACMKKMGLIELKDVKERSFKIEKVAFTRKTNIQKVIKALPTYKFIKSGQGNYYRGEFKGVYIYLNYSDNSFKLLGDSSINSLF